MDHKAVEVLITDPRFQELKYKQEKANVFSVVGQTHTEHWHSSFLSWLLDPNSSMGLGHYPLARLISLAIIQKPDCGFTLKDIFTLHLNDVHFQTEYTFQCPNGKRSIDVYGESDELVIVIENKVNARENYNNSSRGQTQDYYDYIESKRKKGQKALYFFITPDQRQKSYCDNFIKVLYQQVYDSIIVKCMQHPQIREQSLYLLEQYSSNLRELVHNSFPMALVNYDLCSALNKEYKEELMEIYQAASKASPAKEDELALVLYEHYSSVFDEIYLTLLEEYGSTPKEKSKLKTITFTDLFKAGLIDINTTYTLQAENTTFYAKTYCFKNNECRFQLLKDPNTPFTKDGAIVGFYKTTDQATLDIVNNYRKQNGKEPITCFRENTSWKTDKGLTIEELIESL